MCLCRECYKALASLANGASPDGMNDATVHYFYDAFMRLAREIKGKEYENVRNFLAFLDPDNLENADKEVRCAKYRALK